MFITRFTKVAVAAVAATVVAGGTAMALTGGLGLGSKQAAGRVNRAVDKAVVAVPTVDGVVTVNGKPATDSESSAGAGASTSGSGASVGGSSGTSTGAGGTTGGASGGIVGPSTGMGAGTGGTGVGTGTGGTGTATGTGGSGAGGTGTGGTGTGSGGTGTGTGTGTGGTGVGTVTPPTVPSDVSLYRSGTYTVTVPGTPAVSKKLCLSGEVNRCKTMSVPAVNAVSMTVDYSANAGTTPPTFSVTPCDGGLGVTVAGITPGTYVSVHADGVDVYTTLTGNEVSQTASLCNP